MVESGQNWELFGYDTRKLGRHFTAAWRDLLWAESSPVRRRLDEAVVLRTPEGEATWQAGAPSPGVAAKCRAVLLPDDLALTRTLRFPVAVEADLADALALEAAASSPFATDDTATGWLVTHRDEQVLQVQLVIVSKSAAMTYIARQYDSHDSVAQEVWVAVNGGMVVVAGFGESDRHSRYRRRLLRVGAMAGGAALLLLVTVLVGAGFKKWEFERLSAVEETTRQEAAQALRLRTTLGGANAVIEAVNAISAEYPNPHTELARLTHLLDDDVYVERLSIEGNAMDLRGRALDAASVMELLAKQPAYAGVTAGSPIRSLPGTRQEQFHLKITRAGDGQ